MSLAAVMMVKDEADIIDGTLSHLREHVDAIYVLDNMSTDGTTDILHSSSATVIADRDVTYRQSEKMTGLAVKAMRDGHTWVVPVDADEIWTAGDGRLLAETVAGMGPDVQIVTAALYDHLPTGDDPAGEPRPQLRIGWRMRSPGGLPKIAARTHRNLTIHPGNHGANYGSLKALTVSGLRVDHFTWRTPEQYLRKIRNGLVAYAQVVRRDIGVHWRMHEHATDEQIMEHFREWFYCPDPGSRTDLVYDPLLADGDGGFRRGVG